MRTHSMISVLRTRYIRVTGILLRVFSWILLFHVVLIASQGAGLKDAQAIMMCPRPVEILFRNSVNGDLKDSLDERTKDLISEIITESTNGNMALIWRTNNETIVMRTSHRACDSESLEKKTRVPRVFRIDNDNIIGVVYEARNLPRI